MGEVEFGLYLSDSHELNVERRSEARNFVGHVLLKAISRPTTKCSRIDYHGWLPNSFECSRPTHWAGAQSSLTRTLAEIRGCPVLHVHRHAPRHDVRPQNRLQGAFGEVGWQLRVVVSGS